MGGTTAKICLIDDFRPDTSRNFEVDRQARFVKGSGLPLRIPVIEMVEIGAGGGSIARLDATRRIRVGPASAGSEPGPACYGRGGTAPTVTDADVALGRIDPASFAGGRLPLDPDAARAALLAADRRRRSASMPSLAALGVAEMVDETMANAARVHAVERGADVAERTLIAFGGAAPIHAARLAEKLGIARIVVPTARRGRLGGGLPAGARRLPGGALAPSAPGGLRPGAGQRGVRAARARGARAWSRRRRPMPRSSRAGSRTCAMSARATRSWRACRCAPLDADDRATLRAPSTTPIARSTAG